MTADSNVVIREKSKEIRCSQSAYMTLLSSLATDLDLMLNDLRSTPPRFIQPRSSFTNNVPISSTTHSTSTFSGYLSSIPPSLAQTHIGTTSDTTIAVSGIPTTSTITTATTDSFKSHNRIAFNNNNSNKNNINNNTNTNDNNNNNNNNTVIRSHRPNIDVEDNDHLNLAQHNREDDDNDENNPHTLHQNYQTNCLSHDELTQSRVTLISSSDGGILAAGETSSETSSHDSATSPQCDLSLIERLLRTHPVWFLPGIQRAGAVHLLQGKEEGNFVVRASSQPNTMAVSVRLPPNTGPYIEHYLIQSNVGKLSLESSRFKFDSIPALIAHYAQCCDELPVQLTLPRALRDAKNRQQISSLALLGQEFWRYPMASPKPTNILSPTLTSHLIDSFNTNSISPMSTSTLFCQNSNSNCQTNKSDQQHQSELLLSANNNNGGIGTPSDTTSSLSSFTTSNGQQLVSPESVDSIILTMSPAENNKTGIIGKTSTFKQPTIPQHHLYTASQQQYFSKPLADNDVVNIEMEKQIHAFNSNASNFANNSVIDNNKTAENNVRTQRPTPPSTLNLGPLLRTPPAPPPRWSKPPTPISPVAAAGADTQQTNNFTVTTTVTFSVDANKSSQIVEVTSPTTNTTFQSISKRLSPEGECKSHLDSLNRQKCNRWPPQRSTSRDSNQVYNQQVLSSDSVETPTGRHKRNKFKKESKHYQESDILESPSIYCRSALGDKISDYEDLWTTPDSHKPIDRRTNVMSSFRPTKVNGPKPDLLPETPTITSLDCNLLSPPSSVTSSNQSPPLSTHSIQTEFSLIPKINTDENLTSLMADNSENVAYPHLSTDYVHNDQDNRQQQQTQNVIRIEERTTEFITQSLNQSENNEINLNNKKEHHLQYKSNQMCNDECESSNNQQNVGLQSPQFEFKENNMLQPRNRLGLIITAQNFIDSDTLNSPSTSFLTPITTRSKQGSPFYAEPADALLQQKNVIRRKVNPRSVGASPNQRYSAPPKGPIVSLPLTSPIEYEKNIISGSLEDIKKKQRKVRGRLDPWPLDSSWEFMGTEDPDNDYDSDLHWSDNHHQQKQQPSSSANQLTNGIEEKIIQNDLICSTLTVHQIMSKRYPDIKLPEVVKPTLPRDFIEPHCPNSVYRTIEKGQRISAYDNINKYKSNITSFLNCPDSTQSDDGTVFSEPWDSSQWDSFLPQDDSMDTTIHLSKCRPAVYLSEDDTLVEEHSNTLRSNAHQSQQKVATILRSRSCRDREILCHPRNKSGQPGCAGASIGAYAMQLASDRTTTFARNIENFISCTKDSREGAPQIVMRNMRQFMSGMKNYLVKHGEGDFQREVQRARSQLKSDEFLNLDSILEGVMHKLVVLPLREHLYGLFVDFYVKTGDVQNLIENIRHASMRVPTDFGIRPTIIPPSIDAMRHIALMLTRLQDSELPFEKLELLLAAITSIFESTGCPRGQQLSADDFLPLLVLVVAKCGFFSAEIEAEFMWGLLQPSLLNGEAGYYLTALCSAVHVLKTFTALDNEITKSIDWRSSTLPASSSVLRVIIPDELNGSLQTRTLPVRPHTTTKEVCRIIAHKARITNPQDYGLFKLVDGEETLLLDAECPQDARIAAKGKHCMLAYKRIDAKIAWPTMNSMPSATLPNY